MGFLTVLEWASRSDQPPQTGMFLSEDRLGFSGLDLCQRASPRPLRRPLSSSLLNLRGSDGGILSFSQICPD